MKLKSLFLTLALILSLATATYAVTFKLRNTSVHSIGLLIPGVMNPNLSPLSWSGLVLNVRQEIYFTKGRKRYLLLVVTEKLEGQELNVPKLIRARKRELGI